MDLFMIIVVFVEFQCLFSYV